MAFLREAAGAWSMQELEFQAATTETVLIRPSVTETEAVRLLCGHYGPFRAGYECLVPLWVAVAMKRGGRASIIAPEWMRVGALSSAAARGGVKRDTAGMLPATSQHHHTTRRFHLRPAPLPADWLREVLARERQVSAAFAELPYNYAQIATLLLAA